MKKTNWKKTIFALLDTGLAVYLLLAVTSFNRPPQGDDTCTAVTIDITDGMANGFLSAEEIKNLLQKKSLYPYNKQLRLVNPRQIEEVLKVSPFVSTAQCFKTNDGTVRIDITQRMPIIRIKSDNGDDYYIDDHGGVMPNSNYISDLIIATGNISRWYAERYLSLLSEYIMGSEFWKNQIVQINVLPDKGIELVPRVGEHIVYIGQLPESNYVGQRREEVNAYLKKKFARLEKFYRFGLSKTGWNRYSYINIEFDNQIICTRRSAKPTHIKPEAAEETEETSPQPTVNEETNKQQTG